MVVYKQHHHNRRLLVLYYLSTPSSVYKYIDELLGCKIRLPAYLKYKNRREAGMLWDKAL